jgi:transposase
LRTRGPKGYSVEFRREAVRLAGSGTRPLSPIAKELGIHLETLRGWRRRAGSGGEVSSATVPSHEEENRRLRREMEILREEREILKKATAFFVRGAR